MTKDKYKALYSQNEGSLTMARKTEDLTIDLVSGAREVRNTMRDAIDALNEANGKRQKSF